VGVDTIRERKINDAVGSAERNGRFGRIARERVKTLTHASSEQNCQNIIHSADCLRLSITIVFSNRCEKYSVVVRRSLEKGT